MNGKILIVDDENAIRRNLSRFFEKKSYHVLTAGTGGEGLEACRRHIVDAVLLDLKLPDMDGMEVLEHIKEDSPETGVVIMTAYGDVEQAVRAIQLQADQFLLKPLDLEALEILVRRIVEGTRTRNRIGYLRNQVSRLSGIPGQKKLRFSGKVEPALKLLAKNPASNVLILGETGTGKGFAARWIHEASSRSSHPFVDINCAGLCRELLETELFGHERGAFTDARECKRGLLEVAHKGAVFLDEVAELSPSIQAKLLKVIEDRSFRRLGGTENIEVDVRIMAATNSELEALVKAGKFRRDLYYRLNVIPLVIPPLRERSDEILPLARDFLEEFNVSMDKRAEDFHPNAEKLLLSYAWPGNVRELRNIVERAVLLSDERSILPRHLPESLRTSKAVPGRPISGDDLSLRAVEKSHISQVLEMCAKNRSRAAGILGIHRSTLIEKIKKFGL